MDSMLCDNILAAFVRASDSDITDGMSWYADAQNLARELDPTTVERAAGIIAAMSPLTSWPLNVRRAREVYANGTCAGMGNNVRKAERIFNGENPRDVLSGPKVTTFFANIMGESDGVTIDRHAIDVAYGKVQSDEERSKAVSGKRYNVIRDAYLHVANILTNEGFAMTGAQLQAIVWVYWRRSVIANFHGDHPVSA